VRDGLRDWLWGQLIRLGLKVLVELSTPLVGEVIALIQAVYAAVQTFLQYESTLKEVFGTIVGTFADLAEHKDAATATRIGQGVIGPTLVRLIVPALDFLAGLFGLGRIADGVQHVLQAARSKVDHALTPLIAALADAVRGVAGGHGHGEQAAPGTISHQDNPKHETIAQAIVAKLEHVDGAPKDFAATRTEKEGQAHQLWSIYHGQLEHGINLSITFADAPDYKGTKEELDFTVVIAPNTTTKKGSIEVAYAIYTTGLDTRLKLTSEAVRQAALKEVNGITDPAQVSPEIVALTKSEPHILERYEGKIGNDGYIQYLSKRAIGGEFDTPLRYLRRRASLKQGKTGEAKWIADAIPGATKNNKVFKVEQANGTYEDRIPDVFTDEYVGDVKNVAKQEFSPQLRDSYIIAKQKAYSETKSRKVFEVDGTTPITKIRSFIIIVRPGTKIYTPLTTALDATFDTIK